MPGYDGTGPRGEGPMTGGGRGYCVVPEVIADPVTVREALISTGAEEEAEEAGGTCITLPECRDG